MPSYDDLPSRSAQCPECGGALQRGISEQSTANGTKNRLVGGQHRGVEKTCRQCGWTDTNYE
jgi:predicted nucleic-acid-binding Zn-ribbon protein